MLRSRFLSGLLAVAALLALAGAVRDAGAIPVFARRYGVSCAQCHAPFPRVKAFGDMFAGHGFRMVPGEEPGDTLTTGDDLLMLGRAFPMAMRMDMNVQLFHDDVDDTRTDLQTPWNLKILSSAALSKELSYYFYFFLYERGEVGGVEDAFIQWNDVGGKPLDLIAGQFQVSDPLFKRETRLPFEDYTIYRARIGSLPTDLTYDRGFMAIWEQAPVTITGQLVNGNGRGPADEHLTLDDDGPKNLVGRVSWDALPEQVRLGAFGYVGRQDGQVSSGPRVRAEVSYVGADATLGMGPWELNAQYLRRHDRRPTFTPGEPDAVTEGGFVEALWVPEESRWYGYGLWNHVDCDRPILNPRAGGASDVSRFQTFAAGGGYLVQRNVRVQGEAGWDSERERIRATLSMHAAY